MIGTEFVMHGIRFDNLPPCEQRLCGQKKLDKYQKYKEIFCIIYLLTDTKR